VLWNVEVIELWPTGIIMSCSDGSTFVAFVIFPSSRRETIYSSLDLWNCTALMS
jgi:hypothetical protein